MTPDDREGLHGTNVIKGTILVLGLGAAFVVWKFFKHNWLADQGYLPAGMRDYWMVYAVLVAAVLMWAVATRLRS